MLSRSNDALKRAAGDVVRSLPDASDLRPLASVRDDQSVAEAVAKARIEVKRLSREYTRRKRAAGETVDRCSARAVQAKAALGGVVRTVKAAENVDKYIVAGSMVSGRTKEGRTSLWRNKLDLHLREQSALTTREESSALVLELEGTAAQQVRDDLISGTKEWLQYVCRQVENDIKIKVYEEWTRLDGELPIADPVHGQGSPLGKLQVPLPWETPGASEEGWWTRFEPPEFSHRAKVPGRWAELGRFVRQNAFLGAMVLGLAGLSRQYSLVVAAAFLLPLGWFVIQRDRQKKLDKAEEDALKGIQSDLVNWAETRLVRAETRVTGHVQFQLKTTVRLQWVEWFRSTVLPARVRAENDLSDAETALSAARELERKLDKSWPQRELTKLEGLLKER